MDFEAFKTRCKEKGYSASSLVTELGISKSNITNWRNGGNPSYETYFKLYGCIYGVYYNKLDKKYNVERFDNMEDANAFMELKATDRHRFIYGRKLTDRRTVILLIGEKAVIDLDMKSINEKISKAVG